MSGPRPNERPNTVAPDRKVVMTSAPRPSPSWSSSVAPRTSSTATSSPARASTTPMTKGEYHLGDVVEIAGRWSDQQDQVLGRDPPGAEGRARLGPCCARDLVAGLRANGRSLEIQRPAVFHFDRTPRSKQMIQVGDKLPAGHLNEFIEVEGNGCSLGPTSLRRLPKALTGRQDDRCLACPALIRRPCSASMCRLREPRPPNAEGRRRRSGACRVNHAFVMGAWGRDRRPPAKVRMMADGSAAFREGDRPDAGPRLRVVWACAATAIWMLVVDGVGQSRSTSRAPAGCPGQLTPDALICPGEVRILTLPATLSASMRHVALRFLPRLQIRSFAESSDVFSPHRGATQARPGFRKTDNGRRLSLGLLASDRTSWGTQWSNASATRRRGQHWREVRHVHQVLGGSKRRFYAGIGDHQGQHQEAAPRGRVKKGGFSAPSSCAP